MGPVLIVIGMATVGGFIAEVHVITFDYPGRVDDDSGGGITALFLWNITLKIASSVRFCSRQRVV